MDRAGLVLTVRHARRVLGAHTPAPTCIHFCVYSGHLFNILFSVSGFAFGSGPDYDSVSVGALAMRHIAGRGGFQSSSHRDRHLLLFGDRSGRGSKGGSGRLGYRLQRGSSREGHRVLREWRKCLPRGARGRLRNRMTRGELRLEDAAHHIGNLRAE